MIKLSPPSGSACAVRHTDAGMEIDVPPMGYTGVAASLRVLGIAFLVLPTLITALILTAGIEDAFLLVLLLPAVLCTLGFFFLRSGRNMARTRSQLRFYDDGRLQIEVEKPSDHREYHWDPGEVQRVDMAASNVTVNNRKLMELCIHWQRDSLKLWRGRDPRELEWLANATRSALGI